jgi:hypothetical protein
MGRFQRWVVSPQGYLTFALILAINAELDYSHGSKSLAYVFAALTIAMCVRAWMSWRSAKRRP